MGLIMNVGIVGFGLIGKKRALADADRLLRELMDELSSLECAIKSALSE